MSITQNLCALALKGVVGGACKVTGVEAGVGAVDGVVNFLTQRFFRIHIPLDHSRTLD